MKTFIAQNELKELSARFKSETGNYPLLALLVIIIVLTIVLHCIEIGAIANPFGNKLKYYMKLQKNDTACDSNFNATNFYLRYAPTFYLVLLSGHGELCRTATRDGHSL